MGLKTTRIAVLCNYELLPERVGGMDYFFWLFDQKCRENNITVDWFFPNTATHGSYTQFNIIPTAYGEAAIFFADYIQKQPQRYSHVFTHFVEICAPVFKKISQLSKARVIAVDHNPRPLGGYPLKKKIQKKIKGLLYARYIDTFIGVSDYTVNELLRDFGPLIQSKTQTIYNGVLIDNIAARLHRNETAPSFLVVSHLRLSKGIQDLIAAVAQLPPQIKEKLRIDVYGDGPHKASLLAQVAQNRVEAVFSFKGSVSNLSQLYNQYDYLLQPTHMECFSLSILESLAANVPVVTTAVGGNEEAVTHGQNGIIFSAKDVPALAAIIESLFLGKTVIRGNTRTLIAEKFSLQKMVDNYFSLLNDIP